jgi:hypothetical protein
LIQACRDVLRAFAGLELVSVEPADVEEIVFGFGPGGTRKLFCEESDVAVAGHEPGAGDAIFERLPGGCFEKGDRTAAIAAARSLLGRRVALVHHGVGNRLRVEFEGGGEIRLRRPGLPWDWSVCHTAREAVLDAYATPERGPLARRDLVVWGDDDERPLHRVSGGLGRVGGSAAGAALLDAPEIPRPRGFLAMLASLPLTACSAWSALEFGDLAPDADGDLAGRISLALGHAGLLVRAPGAAPREVLARWSDDDPEALEAVAAPLIGQRATVEHHEDGRLDLAFEGGTTLTLQPTARERPVWRALDGATRRVVHAMYDGSLAETPDTETFQLARAVVGGGLGALRAPAGRPVRPVVRSRQAAAGTPRAIHPCSRILGAMIGMLLVRADTPPSRDMSLRLSFYAAATLHARSCDVTVVAPDGERTLFHRTPHGDLSDMEAAVAAVDELAVGQRVAGVEHGEDHRLTVAFTGGAAVVLTSGTWWTHDWQLQHLSSGAVLTAHAALARPAATDTGRLTLTGSAVDRPGTVRGALGRVARVKPDRRLLLRRRVGDARDVLAALVGLELTDIDDWDLFFGVDEEPDGVLLRRGWSDVIVAAPGAPPDREPLGPEAADALFEALLGTRVVEARHDAPGWLRLRFDDGHRVAFSPAVATSPLWTSYYGVDGPRVAAMCDGSLRAVAPDESDFTPERFVYGTLGWLPNYGFKSYG